MKIIIRLFAVLTLLSGISSCDNDEDTPPDPNVVFKATLNGAQEVPAVPTTATGDATLTFNTITKVFTLTVTHTIATPTNGHIHKGAVGVSGGVIFPFASFTSPISYTSPALDATQEADLYAASLLCKYSYSGISPRRDKRTAY